MVSVLVTTQSRITNLSEGPKIFPDGVFRRLRVQTADKDLLGRLLLHGHCPLGVNLASVQPVFLLLQHLQVHTGLLLTSTQKLNQ